MADGQDLVLIMTESLSAETIGCFGDERDATPNLDRILSRSVVFDRFFSSGSRSSHGLFATLFSVPAQLGSPVMHSSLILNRFRGLPTILRERGYLTTFIYGGVYEFTNAEGVLRHAGFDRIIGEPLPDSDAERGSWGYHDRPMFERLLNELSTPSDRPRLTVFFTQSLHNRSLPEHADREALRQRFPVTTRDYHYYRLLAYTDDCLGWFYDEACERGLLDDAVLMIVSDHTNHKNPDLIENYRIPFAIHAPGRLAPARHSTVGGQLDVLPTALSLLGVDAAHASFGADLLARARAGAPGSAFLTIGDSIGWVDDQYLLHDFVDGSRARLYRYVNDTRLRDDVAADEPDRRDAYRRKARAMLQVSRTLLVEDRIFGDDADAGLTATASER